MCLKYKQRKKKAEHKLVETDDNLNRVLDILHELDDRLEPLQIQASLASDYLTMSEELKDIEIAVIAHDLRLCVNENTVLQQKMNALLEIKQALTMHLKDIEVSIQTSRKAMSDVDENLDVSQTSLLEATSELERLEGRKLLLADEKAKCQSANCTVEKSI